MDLSAGAIADQVVSHGILMVGIAVAALWLFPILFKKTLDNGGGDKIRDLVRLENVNQSALHDDRLKDAFASHEQFEEEKFSKIRDDHSLLRDRVARIEEKVS